MARYELMDRIGVGGMAEIFRGKAIAGGGFEKPVAIKRILPHLSQDKRFVELLITEAKTLSQLRHRNVVQIFDVGLGDDGQYFLVMEFVDGVDLGALRDRLEQAGRKIPLAVALHVATEVCEALEHAHRSRGTDGHPIGLVHRDVTPSNVLLSRSGEVKLTDFGIAKRMEEATGHGGVRGKFAYISPEQATNTRVDGRSDVYSLGIVLYELVLGRRLYSHLPDFDALKAVQEARPPRLAETEPDLDPVLARILDTALAPRPDDRYATAGALGATLRGYRYTLAAGVADPTTEIARLVDDARRGRLEADMPQAEPTVVKIATAVGFGGASGIADFDLGNATGPGPGGFDEEETRAVTSLRADAGGGSLGFDDLETRPVAPGVAGMARMIDVPPRRPARASAPGPRPRTLGEKYRGNPAPDLPTPRPTPSEGFARGDLLIGPSAGAPLAGDATTLDARMTPRRRRAILIAGVACVVCAVIAFVAVGVLGGGQDAPAVVLPDAASPSPVPALAPAPPDAGVVRRKHTPRKKRVRRPPAKRPRSR